MPTYEYHCSICDRRFEVRQGINDDPLSACPECGGSVRRLITGGSGFMVKGPGGIPAAAKPACGRESSCCGRETPCGKSGHCID